MKRTAFLLAILLSCSAILAFDESSIEGRWTARAYFLSYRDLDYQDFFDEFFVFNFSQDGTGSMTVRQSEVERPIGGSIRWSTIPRFDIDYNELDDEVTISIQAGAETLFLTINTTLNIFKLDWTLEGKKVVSFGMIFQDQN